MGNHTVDCDDCGWDLRGLSGGHAPDCPTRNGGKKAEAAAEITTLRARVAEVEKERDEGLRRENDANVAAFNHLRRAERAEAALATARRDALEEALDAVWETDSVELAKYGVHKIMDRIRALANEAKTMTPVIDRGMHD
jgi:hypothetical protein